MIWLVSVKSMHNGKSEHRCPNIKSALAILSLYFSGKRLRAFAEILRQDGAIDFDNGYLAVEFFPVKEIVGSRHQSLAELENEAE